MPANGVACLPSLSYVPEPRHMRVILNTLLLFFFFFFFLFCFVARFQWRNSALRSGWWIEATCDGLWRSKHCVHYSYSKHSFFLMGARISVWNFEHFRAAEPCHTLQTWWLPPDEKVEILSRKMRALLEEESKSRKKKQKKKKPLRLHFDGCECKNTRVLRFRCTLNNPRWSKLIRCASLLYRSFGT